MKNLGRIITESRPVAVYNADKKELVILFSQQNMVAKHFLPLDAKGKSGRITYALSKNKKISKTVFDYAIAIRYANKEQIEQLGGQMFLVFNGYPPPRQVSMKGFDSTRGTMFKDHCENRKYKNNY